MNERLTKAEISMWLDHPVTIRFHELLKRHKQELETELREYMLNVKAVNDMDVGQFRGQINSCDSILELKETLFNLSEVYSEEENGEENPVPSPRTQSSSESQEV